MNKLLILFAVLLTFSVSAQESVSESNTVPPKRPTLTVNVVFPKLNVTQQTAKATGDITAKETAAVTAQVSALTLNRLVADVGDYVEKGQLLAEYDDAAVQNDIAQAQATLRQAKIAAEQANKNAKRVKRLGKSSAMSQIERDNYLFQARREQANVTAAKAVLANQKLRADHAKVTAPVSGLVSEKQAVLGSVGNPGTPLFSLIVDGELEWRANVPDRILAVLQPAMSVEVEITAGNDTVTVFGKVRRIAPTINTKTRQGVVHVDLQKHPILRQGLFVSGKFILGEKTQLSLPVACVIRKDGYSYVFTVGEDNRVSQKKIDVGQTTDKRVTVLSGLRAEDRVVSAGVGFLNHGDLVKVVEK